MRLQGDPSIPPQGEALIRERWDARNQAFREAAGIVETFKVAFPQTDEIKATVEALRQAILRKVNP